jgi:hypothetical protein
VDGPERVVGTHFSAPAQTTRSIRQHDAVQVARTPDHLQDVLVRPFRQAGLRVGERAEPGAG